MMRAATLHDVREVLSSPAALQFFEAWGRVAAERASTEELLEGLSTQLSSAEGRVRHAEESARVFAARAEEERRRALEPGLDATLRPFVQLEAEALSAALLSRAKAALSEASERRRRAMQLSSQAAQAERALEDARREQDRLRIEAGALGGYVGESSLFFADAEVPGGVFVVPLVTLTLEPSPLQAFVLHRLGPGSSLARAAAVRDTPAADAPEIGGETLTPGPLDPPDAADTIERTELP